MLGKSAKIKIDEANKAQLLVMRKILFASLIRNLQHEEKEGMYLLSLNALLEFEKLTRHITDSELIKN